MSGSTPDPLGGSLLRPGRSGPDAQGRRKVHPVTPFVHGLRVIPVVVVIAVSLFTRGVAHRTPAWGAAIVGGAIGLALLVTVVQYVAWRRLTYWFDDDGDLRVDSGVLVRQQRRLQLSRLQAVDVVAPLLARLVGMAEVRVEVAGSGDSKAVLQYLTRAEADELRNEIVARSAGVRHDSGEAPEQVLATVPPGDLLLSLVLRGTTALLLLATAAVVAAAVMTAGPAGLVFVVVGGAPIFTLFSEFTKYYGFTVARAQDGLRLRRGLLQTQHQTVPPGRVQAVGLTEPLLWRRRGWVRVEINVAGIAGGTDSGSDSMLLPVAPWPVARVALGQILPAVPDGSVIDEAYKARVSDLGKRHPVTRGLAGAGPEPPRWGRWCRGIAVDRPPGAAVRRGEAPIGEQARRPALRPHRPLHRLERIERGVADVFQTADVEIACTLVFECGQRRVFAEDVGGAPVGEGLGKAHAPGHLRHDPPVRLCLARQGQKGALARDAALGIGHRAVLFAPGGGRQQHMGIGPDGVVAGDVLGNDQQIEFAQRLAHMARIWQRHRRVGGHHP